MDTKTSEALEGSIEKWEKIVKGEGRDGYGDNCPLCTEFRDTDGTCARCLVQEKTGCDGCIDTPFRKWDKHQKQFHPGTPYRVVMCEECKTLAQQEVYFLKSLREPEEEKIEPQAGDVWQSPCYTLFIYKDNLGKLEYVYSCGTPRQHTLEYIIPQYPYKRIFSLTEYLKDKKEEDGK